MDVQLYKRYVGDINIVIKTLRTETDQKIMTTIKEIGDKIHPSIQLETDYPSNYEIQRVPILDLMVWIEGSKILYEYYSKSVSSKSVVHNRSAMPLRDKRTIITQDILRVILRCSPRLPWEKIKPHLDDYMLRLQFSGYSEQFRKQVLKSAITAYKRIMDQVEKGDRPLYRHKQWKQCERTKYKREKKENWYKRKKTPWKMNTNQLYLFNLQKGIC